MSLAPRHLDTAKNLTCYKCPITQYSSDSSSFSFWKRCGLKTQGMQFLGLYVLFDFLKKPRHLTMVFPSQTVV